MKRRLVRLAVMVGMGWIAPLSAIAQDQPDNTRHWVKFTHRRFFDPLIADPRAAHQQALFPALGKSAPFLQEQTERALMWDIDVGAELPIVALQSEAAVNDGMPPGAWGLGFGLVIDFHMLEDLQDVSNPILNTDYRFSGILKFQRGLREGWRGAKWLSAKLQFGHESTHLGDEYSLAARRRFTEFERVNVSYEWIDMAAALETEVWKLRGGAILTVPFGDSYYSGDTLETAGRVITESNNGMEPYLGAELRGSKGWYASGDLRWKTVYNYAKSSSDAGDRKALSFNVMVGWTREEPEQGSIGIVSPFGRVYYGVNPHGQFRNDPHFWIAGIGIRFHR